MLRRTPETEEQYPWLAAERQERIKLTALAAGLGISVSAALVVLIAGLL